MEKLQQPNINLKATTAILSEDGNAIFGQGFILRKVSKFVIGSTEDAVLPIPVFYDLKTGKIMTEMLPKELRDEFSGKTMETENAKGFTPNNDGSFTVVR